MLSTEMSCSSSISSHGFKSYCPLFIKIFIFGLVCENVQVLQSVSQSFNLMLKLFSLSRHRSMSLILVFFFQLLTVQPKENSLALVYRDKDTLKFVKHVNSSVNKMPNKGFYDISAVYYE